MIEAMKVRGHPYNREQAKNFIIFRFKCDFCENTTKIALKNVVKCRLVHPYASWRFQRLCRPTHELGWNKEDWFGGYNEEERTVLLKQSKQYGWSDLQQIVSASRSQLLKCNK